MRVTRMVTLIAMVMVVFGAEKTLSSATTVIMMMRHHRVQQNNCARERDHYFCNQMLHSKYLAITILDAGQKYRHCKSTKKSRIIDII